jgi:hypothetical protein
MMTADARTRRLRELLLQLPSRKEYLGGQEFSYVKLDDVLAVLDTEGDRAALDTELIRRAIRRLDCGALRCRYCEAESPTWKHAEFCAYAQSVVDVDEARKALSAFESKTDTEGDRPACELCRSEGSTTQHPVIICAWHYQRLAQRLADTEKENDHAKAIDSRRSVE